MTPSAISVLGRLAGRGEWADRDGHRGTFAQWHFLEDRMATTARTIEERCINTTRTLAIDAEERSASGPAPDVMPEFGLTTDHVVDTAWVVLTR